MDATPPSTPSPPSRRRSNPRGQGERLREEIIAAAVTMLDELADDEALSLRAVARTVSIAATSVYLYFPDRDALVLAAMRQSHEELVRTADQAEAEAAAEGPAAQLRARILAQYGWAQAHPGLHKVLHESKVNRSPGVAFKEVLVERTTAAIRRCMDAGVAPSADPGTVAFDLRTAMGGMMSQRINEPDLPWPPAIEQVDRFLTKLVGLPAPTGK